MKFSVATLLALAASALARPYFTNSEYPPLEEGETITLEWDDASGPVTISIMTGDPQNLDFVKDIATDVTGDSFTFTVKDLPNGSYAFRIYDAASVNDPNYTEKFPVTGSTVTASSSVTRSTTATSSRSSSTSTSDVSSSSSTGSSSTTASRSTTSTTTSATRTTATTTPTNNLNGGQRYSSPLALVFITVAALVFFN